MENQIAVAELKKALAPDLERLLEEAALAAIRTSRLRQQDWTLVKTNAA